MSVELRARKARLMPRMANTLSSPDRGESNAAALVILECAYVRFTNLAVSAEGLINHTQGRVIHQDGSRTGFYGAWHNYVCMW